ncbi:apolipoprotein N-acyltransferase [Rhizobium sp. SG2393]|uniref:apolipoprotein N-acyltransferase n=1 Tax=Rhizobium sp. SG2393 TaxID=3276279 RepID=UPI0036734522
MERLASRVILSSGIGRVFLAMLAGALAVLAQAPFFVILAPFVSFTLLVWLIDGATGRAGAGMIRRRLPAFMIGWWFGFGYFLAGLWWLGAAFLVEADEFAWLMPLGIIGLPAFLAVYFGFATLVARLFWSEGAGRICALAASFGLFEWLRAFLFTGFPWNAIGYAVMPVPLLMQSAGAIGLWAVTTLAVFVFATPALFGTRRGLVPGVAFALVLAAAHVGYGAFVLSRPAPAALDPALPIRIVQPVIDQAKKLDDAERGRIFEEHLALSAAAPAEGRPKPKIIVWPETSIPFILTLNPDALVRIADVLEDGQVLIAGAVRSEDAGPGLPPRYYNSVYVIDDRGQIVAAADKVHLVPFGEYLPFESLLQEAGLQALAASMPGGYSSAPAHQPLTLPGGKVFYPLICYEAIFPDEIEATTATTDALLNITNDGWFGKTPGPFQHFHQAQLRAVETGLPLIRVANTGVSAVVTARGDVVDGLQLDAKGFVDVDLPAKEPRPIPHPWQTRGFLIGCALMLLIALYTRKQST